MSAFALAIFRDWRDRVSAAFLAPAALALALGSSFSYLSPVFLCLGLSAFSALGGWLAGGRYGLGSFGRERMAAAMARLSPARAAWSMIMAGGGAWLACALAAAPCVVLVGRSWPVAPSALALMTAGSLGTWLLSLGAAAASGALKQSTEGAPGFWLAALLFGLTAWVGFLRPWNPFLALWRAMTGRLDAGSLVAPCVSLGVAFALLTLACSKLGPGGRQ